MKFREYITKKNTLLLAGKNAQNNEELIKQVKPDEIVLHTAKPGSPFVVIMGKPKLGDIKVAAIFCARYSHDWREHQSDVIVHKFKGKDISKDKRMKLGTFGVKNFKLIKVKKKWIQEFIDGK